MEVEAFEGAAKLLEERKASQRICRARGEMNQLPTENRAVILAAATLPGFYDKFAIGTAQFSRHFAIGSSNSKRGNPDGDGHDG